MGCTRAEKTKLLNRRLLVCTALTFLSELDAGLSASVAVLHVAGVVAEVALLQSVYGEGDGNFLFPKMLPDCPTGDSREDMERVFEKGLVINERALRPSFIVGNCCSS